LLLRAKHLFVAAMVVPARSSPAKALGAPLAGFPGLLPPRPTLPWRFPVASAGSRRRGKPRAIG
jgi:hypothetical protein